MPDSNSKPSIAFVCLKDIGLFDHPIADIAEGQILWFPKKMAPKGAIGSLIVKTNTRVIVSFGGQETYFARASSFNKGTIRVASVEQAIALGGNTELVPVPTVSSPANDNATL